MFFFMKALMFLEKRSFLSHDASEMGIIHLSYVTEIGILHLK